MNKTLVAYFSASGMTAKLAENIADVLNADLYEIEPEVKYTSADLNWRDKNSRSSIEMNDLSFFPPIKNTLDTVEDYEVIYLGFPVWWYTAPTIIHTFLKSYDFTSKKIILFVTSGGSGLGNTVKNIEQYASGATFIEGGRLSANTSKEDIINWIQGIAL